MRFDWWTLALQVVNFTILAWLLHRFLYRPVLRMVDARRTEIDKRRQDADALAAKAKAELATIAATRDGIAAERSAALQAAAAEAETAAAARRAKAEQDAAALLDAGRKTLAAERTAATAEARELAVDLGIEIAQRLVQEIPAELRAEAWLDRVERHLAGLAPEQRAAALGDLAGAEIGVVTAVPLPAPSEAEWRRRLEPTLGDRVVLRFSADPLLLAGVELHFPAAVLHFSWRDELAALRGEIAGHGDAR